MVLTPEQIKKKLKEASKKGFIHYEIEQIKTHDIRCAFHTEPTQDVKRLLYRKTFLAFVGTIISQDKLEVFTHLMTLPIETVDFMEGVMNELKKIFEAQNRNISFLFQNTELSQDFQDYLEEIGDQDFWQTKGFNAMKSSINKLVVCDLPAANKDEEGNIIQDSKYPKPYYYFLPAENVFDLEFDRTEEIEWIIFKDCHDQDLYHYMDGQKYMTLSIVKGKAIEIVPMTIHDTGYCPVRSFWSTPFNSESKLQKRAPISNSLGKIDWLLFLMISQKHTELYAGFPMIVMYEQKCTYKDDAGNFCDGGQVKSSVRIGNTDEYRESSTACPSCANKSQLGAGTVLTAPARSEQSDPDLLTGVNVVPAETKSLDYLEKRIKQFEAGVIVNTIGLVREPSKEAMNELQIQSGYESRANVLLDVKSNFEKIHKFVLDTLGRMRYGNLYGGSVVFYGDKFYLYDASDLMIDYKAAKDSGTPVFELSEQFKQIINTRYKNNPEMIERFTCLFQIEPFPLVSMKELKDLADVYKATPEELMLKSHFDQLISRFENEYTSISEFMPLAPREKKVEFIRETLLGYLEELQVEEEPAANTTEDQVDPITGKPVNGKEEPAIITT